MTFRLAGVAVAISVRLAQTQTEAAARPQFEVASVRKDVDGPDGPSRYPACAGATFAASVPVRSLIGWAYDARQGYQTPEWAASPNERYSIQAKAAGPVSVVQCKAMVQNLLEDRFQLKLHRESKEMPVFLLVPGKKGSKLQAVEPDSPSEGITLQGRKLGPKSAWDMSLIASYLGMLAGRPVVDRTGYKGQFVFTLEYSRNPADNRPDIFTAVQEQLGLKLEPGRAPVEHLVIDHLDRPAEN